MSLFCPTYWWTRFVCDCPHIGLLQMQMSGLSHLLLDEVRLWLSTDRITTNIRIVSNADLERESSFPPRAILRIEYLHRRHGNGRPHIHLHLWTPMTIPTSISSFLQQDDIPVMAAVAVREKVVSIGHFSPCFYLQSLKFFFVRSNQKQLYVLTTLKIREK